MFYIISTIGLILAIIVGITVSYIADAQSGDE